MAGFSLPPLLLLEGTKGSRTTVFAGRLRLLMDVLLMGFTCGGGLGFGSYGLFKMTFDSVRRN